MTEISEEVSRILAIIDANYSKNQLKMLKFLAQAVMPYSLQLEGCNSIPELYKLMRESQTLQYFNYRYTLSLLRHMLLITGCKQLDILQAHCHEEFDLETVASSLPYYELLLCLAKRLCQNNSNYERLLNSLNEKKLSKSKYDISSPVDLFQSMICKGTLDPSNTHSLKKELVLILKAAGLHNEVQFVQGSLHSDQLTSSKDRTSQEDELHPLLSLQALDGHKSERRRAIMKRPLYTKCKVCCIGSVSGLIIIFLTGAVISFIYSKPSSSLLSHIQPVYGPQPLIYSPFSHIDSLYYKEIESIIHVDRIEDIDNYNLTICDASCPLKVVTLHSWVKGVCPKDRFFPNCYVNFLGYQDPGLDSQFYSQYMLINSEVTFAIVELSQTEPVHLCITGDRDSCYQIFMTTTTKLMDCQELLAFNEMNNYTRIFTAQRNCYYCAVWLLNGNQSIKYTINSAIESYELQSPHSRCENFCKSKEITFDLGYRWHGVATQKHDMCVLIQQNGKDLYHNITIVTKAISSLENIPFISGIISVILLLPMIIALIVTTVVSFCCKFSL